MENLYGPIKTAICSFGMSGEVFHAPLLSSNKKLEVSSILQRSSDSALNFYPKINIVKDFTDIINDKEIDLVIVNTPNTLHFSMAEAALLAGKHVVIEKPITPTSKEAQRLIDLAKEKNLILSVFHNKRFENDYLTLKYILENNLVGKPIELNWHYDRYRTHITHKKWKESNLPGAGTLYDLGSHLIDSTLSLFGNPISITSNLRVLREGGESTDYFTIRLDYQDLTVNLASSTMVREAGPQLMIHGTLGSYLKNGSDPQELQLKNGLRPGNLGWGEEENLKGILHTETNGIITRDFLNNEKGCYENYYENIAEAIHGKQSLLIKPEDALNTIKIIELAIQSDQEKRTVFL